MIKHILNTLLFALLFLSLIEAKEVRGRAAAAKKSTKRELNAWDQRGGIIAGFFMHGRGSMDGGGMMGDDEDDDDDDDDDDGVIVVYRKIFTIQSLAFGQPFSPFFLMSHDSTAAPLFTLGTRPTRELAYLAENGVPHRLVELYTGQPGVSYAGIFMEEPPYFVGQPFNISIPFMPGYDLITIASMAINTNDCFVAVNGVNFDQIRQTTSPGYDSGSEENNENCESIPGPGCRTFGNVASGNGEGVVHIHRGFFGIGDLLPRSNYDWRNPMMSVELVDTVEDIIDTLSCPDEIEDAINSLCYSDGLRCEYGREICCGETYPALVCDCLDGLFRCYNTDACFNPTCPP